MTYLLINTLKYLLSLMLALGAGLYLHPRKKRSDRLTHLLIALIIGIVTWALVSFLTYTRISWLSSLIITVLGLIGLLKNKTLLKISHKFNSTSKAMLACVLIGTALQLLPVIPSGLQYHDGYRIFGVNGHDGTWHVALQSTLSRYPNSFPTLAGEDLKGYHMLIDIWGSSLVTTFDLNPFFLTFIAMPLTFSLITGLGIFILVHQLTKSRTAAVVSTFMNYTAGTISYLLPLFLDRPWSESTFWSQQSISTFINLPLGASFAITIIILMLYRHWLHKPDTRTMLILSILIGSLVSVKVYTGIVVLLAFALVQTYHFLRQKSFTAIVPVVVSGFIAATLVLPHLSPKVGLTFLPGWFAKTMLEAPDRLGYPTWELNRVTYAYHHNIPRLIMLWTQAVAIFIVGNFGLRLVGFLAWRRTLSGNSSINHIICFLTAAAIVSILLPSLFVQKGVIWNTIQFLYVGLWMLNIATGLAIAKLPKTSHQVIAALVIVAASAPTSIKTLAAYTNMYRQQIDYTSISWSEVSVLETLKQLPPGNLLTPYHWTAYIPAVSGQPVYFSDDTQAVLTGKAFEDRQQLQSKIFCENMNPAEIKVHLSEKQIRYLYQPYRDDFDCNKTDFQTFDFLTVISKNASGVLYKYD